MIIFIITFLGIKNYETFITSDQNKIGHKFI